MAKLVRTGPDGEAEIVDPKELELLFKQVDPLLEQINTLYHQYCAGAEKRPPIERRKVLDRLMARIQNARKSSMSLKFQSNTLMNRYRSHLEQWDKLLRKLEAGKIVRRKVS